MSENTPDFAMRRAVEILAQLHERGRKRHNAPPAPIDRPALLRCDRITLQVGTTQRAAVERELGIGFSYPARGWRTYATKQFGERCLLSLFYNNGVLLAVELYTPRAAHAPNLETRNLGGFALEPGSVRIGMPAAAVPHVFSPAQGGPAAVVYERAFEVRFHGGVAYAMSRKGVIERLALYADLRHAAP